MMTMTTDQSKHPMSTISEHAIRAAALIYKDPGRTKQEYAEEIQRACEEYAQERVEPLRKDIENLLWNLAGCDTIASGNGKPFDYAKELARPALDSVSRMAAALAAEREKVASLRFALRKCVEQLDSDELTTENEESCLHRAFAALDETAPRAKGENKGDGNP